MREALTLFFLIFSYNFLLWYITTFDLSPVPLFPKDPYNLVLILAYNSVLFISWLFGERHRSVQWIGYLFFFQIVALSVHFEDLSVITRDLSPVILTFALVALFESPTEKKLKETWRQREELLREIDRVRSERERVEVHLRMLRSEIEKLEREREKESSGSEALEELERRIGELQRELREYREKESRLLEANRKLFQLLEVVKGDQTVGSREELSSLRRERKKLIKELVGLRELVDIYADENEKLKEENERLRSKLEELRKRLDRAEIELQSPRGRDVEEVYAEVLRSILKLEFSERALKELLKLPAEKRRLFLKELFRFSLREGKENIEPLSTLPNIYKLRFSGGRVYMRRSDGSWEVVGVLASEDDKEKERYIRDVLSKI